MFRTDTALPAGPVCPMPACIAAPTRFHAQARATRSAFRLETRDSAMPARFHVA
ncbi:MAG: hypothetical protein ABW163_08000 [Luteimonas sp.]